MRLDWWKRCYGHGDERIDLSTNLISILYRV